MVSEQLLSWYKMSTERYVPLYTSALEAAWTPLHFSTQSLIAPYEATNALSNSARAARSPTNSTTSKVRLSTYCALILATAARLRVLSSVSKCACRGGSTLFALSLLSEMFLAHLPA